jgi:hypothetical protein
MAEREQIIGGVHDGPLGIMTSGRSRTLSLSGLYWMTWISSFSKIKAPGVITRLAPTAKAFSSVIEMRPLPMSSIRFLIPVARLSPPVSRTWVGLGPSGNLLKDRQTRTRGHI